MAREQWNLNNYPQYAEVLALNLVLDFAKSPLNAIAIPMQNTGILIHADSAFYELFVRLAGSTGAAQRNIIDAIVAHREWELNLRIACGRVLRFLHKHSDSGDELLQETSCVLFAALASGRMIFEDHGSCQFGGWWRKVTFHAAMRAFHDCQPTSFHHCVLVDNDLDRIAVEAPDEINFDDLLVAINRLEGDEIRRVSRHWAFGLSLEETAQRTGLSVTEVWRARQKGSAQIRRFLIGD
jgi:DNA-directed RNA polymerase specialized sigma24 family protein